LSWLLRVAQSVHRGHAETGLARQNETFDFAISLIGTDMLTTFCALTWQDPVESVWCRPVQRAALSK